MTGARLAAVCRTLLLLLICDVCPLASQASFGSPAQPSEYEVKAAFLLNFVKFIEWPRRPADPPDDPFSICILGEDPFGAALDQIVAGETVNGRRVIVQRVDRVQPSCRVLFLSEFEKSAPKALAGAGPGVLTVGEGEAFTRHGGMIGFVIANRRVRFDVNQRAALHASLQISSRLLNVARTVVK